MELLIVLLIMVLFALAAMRWGYDSTEPVNSPEWEKRLAPPFVLQYPQAGRERKGVPAASSKESILLKPEKVK
jgi:hypothetical protein